MDNERHALEGIKPFTLEDFKLAVADMRATPNFHKIKIIIACSPCQAEAAKELLKSMGLTGEKE